MPNKTKDQLFEENIEQGQVLDAIADLVTDSELSDSVKIDAIVDELEFEDEDQDEDEGDDA